MSTRPPVYDQFRKVCNSKPGELVTTSELTSLLASHFGTPNGSVQPADYCYNRRNKSSKPLKMCLFLQISQGEYRYLGPNASYSGLVTHSQKGSGTDLIVGEWIDGVFHPQEGANFETTPPRPGGSTHKPEKKGDSSDDSNAQLQILTRQQIQNLYEEYLQILDQETRLFGVNPSETRHLIGRIGEFKVALALDGTLAHQVNQEGFDVVARGKRVSVKTTTQTQMSRFVTVNPSTAHLVDTLYVLQYVSGEFKTVYHGPMSSAMEIGRDYQGDLELPLGKLKQLNADIQSELNCEIEQT